MKLDNSVALAVGGLDVLQTGNEIAICWGAPDRLACGRLWLTRDEAQIVLDKLAVALQEPDELAEKEARA
jgi:hypothetical protein